LLTDFRSRTPARTLTSPRHDRRTALNAISGGPARDLPRGPSSLPRGALRAARRARSRRRRRWWPRFFRGRSGARGRGASPARWR